MTSSHRLTGHALGLVLALAAHAAAAQTGGWKPTNGPYGGTIITELAVHPAGDVFAGTESGLFRSTDGGARWSQTDTGFASTLVRSLLTGSDGVLLAGTASGLYRSADRGATWAPGGLDGTPVTSLGMDAEGRLFAGTAAGEVHRRDGSGWTRLHDGLPGGTSPITALAAGNGVLLAGAGAGTTGGGGVFRSTDAGASWQSAFTGLHSFDVTDLVYSSKGGFFVTTREGELYRSLDGQSWTLRMSASTPLLSLFVRSTGELLVGLDGAIVQFNSTGMIPMATMQVGAGTVDAIAIDARNRLFAGTAGGGVYRSDDGGATWRPYNTGLGCIVTALAFGRRGLLFAGTYGGGVFRSDDGGQTWEPANRDLKSLSVEALAIRDDGVVFAGTTDGQIFRSDDDGATWTDTRSLAAPYGVRGLSFNAAGDLFAGTRYGLWKLRRGGTTWQYAGLAGFDIKASAIAPGGEMYASLPNRLMRSPDGGLTWASADLMLEVQALTVNAAGDVFAAPVAGGAYRSLNTGLPAHVWERIDTTLAVRDVRAFLVTPAGTLLAATYGGGVHESLDNGGLWHPASDGLANLHTRALAVHPATGTVYAGTNAGVFRNDRVGVNTAADEPALPASFALGQNYPNPFNPVTSIAFDVPAAAHVTLAVYDLLGRRVATLVDAPLVPGRHRATFDAAGLASGTYVYRLRSGAFHTARLLTVTK